MRTAVRARAALLGAAAVLLVAGVTSAVDAPDASATTSTTTLATGVTLTHSAFTIRSGSKTLPESVYTIHVALGARTHLVASTPSRLIGSNRISTLALGRQENAIAGINGDTFYFSDPTVQPRGGLVYNGATVKSPLQGKLAVLYVLSNGQAGIGDPGFAGSFSGGPGHLHNINSYNSLENARNGGVTLTDARELSHSLPHCAVMTLRPTGTAHQYTMASYQPSTTAYHRVAVGWSALVTCSAAARDYLTGLHLHAGSPVSASVGYRVSGIHTAISGVRVLVAGGRAYNDRTGINVYGNKNLPETYACVRNGGRSVDLGAVEGQRTAAAGMTYAQLTSYLVGQHCTSAMVLDGSTSTTLVARLPRRSLAVLNRTTHAGAPQQVVDGLYVQTR